MTQFKTTSLADRVFAKLENDIIFGVYPRGEILTELKLVEQLGVSRTPIREALHRLEEERLIEDTGKGSRVLGITLDDLTDLLNIRLRIEGLATYYATKNITDEGLRELAHVLDLQEFYFSKHDTEHIREMDDQFHALLCHLSKRFRKASNEDQARTAEVVQEHRKIYDAIAARDAELAEVLTVEHIAHAKASMLKRVKQNG